MRSLHLSLLLLPTATTAQTLIRVCGSSYSDATVNCTINPSCPTGDGCPSDKDTCFALPEESCQAPPSASPIITPLQVCGMDYEDAKSHCDNLCELGCGALEACFAVSPDECVVEMDTESDLLTEDEGGDPVLIMEEATDVAVCGLSFADAAANCETGTPCSSSGAGMECATGQACFVVPLVNCTAAVTGSTVTMTMVNTTAPNVEETPAPAPTEPPVKPTHVFVCGVDYSDAELNCNGNTECPSGDGCSGGDTCFAIPYDNCRPAAVTTVAAGTTVALEGSTVSAVGTTPAPGTTEAAGNATVAFEGTTQAATTAAAGEPNLFFCGESYEVAESNCFTNVPCPAGGGCPEGQACFGIPNECKSPEPTLSPSAGATETITNLTVSTEDAHNVTEAVNDTTPALLRTVEPSLSPVTAAPTEAPIVNTHFCGANYTDAEANCDFDRACPGGFECPSGQTCFTGITCAATASASTAAAEPTPTATPDTDGATTSPTLRGTSGASSEGSILVSTQETVDLANLLVYRYCGFSPDDARDNCATATPCLNGTDYNCPSMQTCFELEEACSSVPGDSTGGGDVTPATPVPSVPATDKPVFDPSITSFCGVDYDDAQDNCYSATPCPGNSNAECGDGQTCFPGITTCEIPETPSPTPAVTEVGGNETNTNATLAPAPVVPTTTPTPKPQYDLSGFGDSNSGRDPSGSVVHDYSMGVLISGLMCVVATLMF